MKKITAIILLLIFMTGCTGKKWNYIPWWINNNSIEVVPEYNSDLENED